MSYRDRYGIYDDDDGDDMFDDNPNELYGVRDGTLFIIDATPPMFAKREGEDSYFIESMKSYVQILKQKLVWSRQDWAGLILFGTNQWDKDPEIKHVLTVHSLSLITTDRLKEAMNIIDGKSEFGENIACSTAYPLHDVLWHAVQAFSSVKLHIWMRRVILFTCQDDPPLTSQDEKHRIRVKAKSFSNIALELNVIGLGDNWNHECFYKDLEMASGKIDNEDYTRTPKEDLIKQVKRLSRNMAKLPWRLGEDVTLDVCVRPICVKKEYLKKEAMSREQNTPLTSQSILCKQSDLPEQGNEDADGELPPPVLETEIKMYQEFGGRKIYFTPEEVKFLSATSKIGIDLICAKPKSFHPINHLKAPYFVKNNRSNRKDNQLLFGALLNKCDSKNLMLICSATLRENFATKLYTMIPDVEKGGFYLYQLAFKENVRELAEHFRNYIYDGDFQKPPTEPEGVALLEKIIQKLRIRYDPEMFPNPKLQVQLQTLETVALDLEEQELPEDATIPMKDMMHSRVANLLNEFNEMFIDQADSESEGPSRKRSRREPGNVSLPAEEKIRELVNTSMLDTLKVADLKEILKNVGIKVSGNKTELINRVKAYYA